MSSPINNEVIAGMTQAELADVAAIALGRLEPGIQPFPLFKQFARHVVTSTVEIAAFTESPDGGRVLMARRPNDDPWWHGHWHLPGTILLPTDEAEDVRDYETPVDRLIAAEFSGSIIRTSDVHIFDVQRRTIPRGKEQTVFGWITIALSDGYDTITGGQTFSAENVRDELELSGQQVIEGHIDTIELALKKKNERL